MSYSKNKVTSIQTLIQNFFLERLIQQRGVTSRTIESYRDTFKIYIKYLQEILYLICDYPHKHYTFKHFEA